MKKLILKTFSIGLMSLMVVGCTNQPKVLKANPNLPTVKYVNALGDRSSIALEWGRVDSQNIAGYYISRSEDGKKFKTIKTIKDTDITHFVDEDLKTGKKYYYRVFTFDKDGTPSKDILKETGTKRNIFKVTGLKEIKLNKKGVVKFIFTPHRNERVVGYEVERYNNEKWENIKTLKPRLNIEVLDKNLKDGKTYQYRVIAFSFDGLKSNPSKVLSIKTLSKPSEVGGVTATNDLPKKIIVKWKANSNSKKYEIYKSDSLNGIYTLYKSVDKPIFEDNINEDGEVRYYKIVSVTKNGIKSVMPKLGTMGQTLAIPIAPTVSKDANSPKFTISSNDGRAKEYEVRRESDKIKIIKNVQSPFVDTLPDSNGTKTYEYRFYEIDKYGLKSEPSEVIEVTK